MMNDEINAVLLIKSLIVFIIMIYLNLAAKYF